MSMRVSLYKFTPVKDPKREWGFADFILSFGPVPKQINLKIKGCFVMKHADGALYVQLPVIPALGDIKYSPLCWGKDAHKDFVYKSQKAIKTTYPPERWSEGKWCVMMGKEVKPQETVSEAPGIVELKFRKVLDLKALKLFQTPPKSENKTKDKSSPCQTPKSGMKAQTTQTKFRK